MSQKPDTCSKKFDDTVPGLFELFVNVADVRFFETPCSCMVHCCGNIVILTTFLLTAENRTGESKNINMFVAANYAVREHGMEIKP